MKKAKKMNVNDLGFEEELKPTHILSRLEYDLWGSKNLENMKLNNEPFLKYMNKERKNDNTIFKTKKRKVHKKA